MSSEAIRRLRTPRTRRYLEPFFGVEASVGEVASQLGESIATVWSQVRRMEAAGLIHETRRVARAGRSIRYYRTIADEFEILVGDLPEDTLEDILEFGDRESRRRLRAGLVKLVSTSGLSDQELVVRIRRLPNGSLDVSPGLAGGKKLPPLPGWSSWSELALTQAEARQLRGELDALWQRWATPTTPSGPGRVRRPHLLRLAMAPAPELRA